VTSSAVAMGKMRCAANRAPAVLLLPLYQRHARPISPWELGDSLVVLRTNKGKDMDINNVCELMNK